MVIITTRGIPYFAYGSNLDLEGMARRVPNAVRGPAATLPGWKLVFRGVADVDKAEGESVLGALWYLDLDGVRALDRYEGYPNMYGREWVSVELIEDGQPRTKMALVYVMPERSDESVIPPSPYYLGVIRDGYRHFDLDRKVLDAAVEESERVINERRPDAKLVPNGKRMVVVSEGMTPATRALHELEDAHQDKKWLRDTIYDVRDAGLSEDQVLDIVAETLDTYRDETGELSSDWDDIPYGIRVA